MPNPFFVKFDSRCQSCGEKVEQGDKMFAMDHQFICEECTPEENICECGNFKKAFYYSCYVCSKDTSEPKQSAQEKTPVFSIVVSELNENLIKLISLCHPDKHNNSETSNEITKWLLKYRNTLKKLHSNL